MMKIREGYQETEIGVIPEEWEVTKIENVICYLKSGLSRKLSDTDIGIPCLRSSNIINGKLKLQDLKFWYKEDPQGAKVEEYILQKGDILVNFINSLAQIGKACIFQNTDIQVIYTTNIFRIKVDKNKVDNRFFFYNTQTNSYEYQVSLITKPAVNQASFTTGDFKNIIFPLPPLPEQQRIAEILSTTDEHIEKLDKTIEDYQLLKKGMMRKLLTEGIGHTEFKDTEIGRIPREWEVVTFKEISNVSQGLQISISKRFKEYKKNRLPYITIQYLNNPHDSNNQYFVEDALNSVICNPEDVLMTRTGNTGIVVTNQHGVFHNNFFKINFDRNMINKEFLVFYLNSIKRLILSYAGSSTIPDLNHSDFYKIPMIIPNLMEQQQIAEILSELDNKIELYIQEQQDYIQLKKSLMEKLLTGKIRTI